MFYSKVIPEHHAAAEILTLSTDAAAIEHYTSKQPDSFTKLCGVLLNAARKELPHRFKQNTRHTDKAGVLEWLQGLPSLCQVPFMNSDIEQLLAKGFIPEGTQPTTSEPITAYWRHLAHIICLYASK